VPRTRPLLLRHLPYFIAAVIVVTLAATLQVDGYVHNILMQATTFAIAVFGLSVVLGLCGQINLAQAAFFGIGAYAVGLGTSDYHLSYWLCLAGGCIIALLADPGSHGGDPADAFHVVVPSLPGYTLSAAPQRVGVGPYEIAGLWSELMTGLGYGQFGAQGGDIGAGVSTWLGVRFPERMTGIHLNYIPGSYRPPMVEGAPPLTDEESRYLQRAADFGAAEGAYAQIQRTKPQTLAVGLNDSPAGLLAWMAEKFFTWSDPQGAQEPVIERDTLLTNAALYWFTGCIGSSFRQYVEGSKRPLVFASGERIEPPLGVAVFPAELPMPPRSWVERCYNVQRWSLMPKGGHFAALEQPELLANDIRAFFRPLR